MTRRLPASAPGVPRAMTTPRPFASALRFVGRYLVAALMIPVGVALGVGGLATWLLRKRGLGEETS